MGRVILIHANCHNTTAKGDFSFAGSIAKDIVKEIQRQGLGELDVILVSALDGLARFESMYGKAVRGRISIDGIDIGLSSLELFDAIEHEVLAFIDANRCKYSAAALIKRVLSPDSKFIFVGNVNQPAFADLFSQAFYRKQTKLEQYGLYDAFDDEDMLIGSAGFGAERFGLPSVAKAEDVQLSAAEQGMVPKEEYGFMYVNAVDSSRDYKLIAQYIKLSGNDQYVLVGDFRSTLLPDIRYAYDKDITLPASKPLPKIIFHQALPYAVMRHTIASATSPLVLSTGITSTLEALQDGKLTYYQDLDCNTDFVTAYLIMLKSIVARDSSLFGAMPGLLIELSTLLFANKPLSRPDMERTKELLEISSVSSRLISANQAIIAQASGKVATKLLGFLGEPRKTKDPVQLANVCISLRKPGEVGSPIHDQALRRAAAWGRLFELKVLIKSMPKADLDKVDSAFGCTALHWAVTSKSFECARVLVNAGVTLDVQDKDGRTALHLAVKNGDRQMIEMLIKEGASLDIEDKASQSPVQCAPDSDTILFIRNCHAPVKRTPS